LSIIKKIALHFARKEFCRKAIAEHANLNVFKKKPSFRITIGLILIAFSYFIGLPTAIILSIIVAAHSNAITATIAASLLYGISWLIFMVAMYLAGPEYGKALSRWAARVILEKILGKEAAKEACSGKDDLENTRIKE
jgi:uncharacterized membrane protein YbhN (UPF0104 family)